MLEGDSYVYRTSRLNRSTAAGTFLALSCSYDNKRDVSCPLTPSEEPRAKLGFESARCVDCVDCVGCEVLLL